LVAVTAGAADAQQIPQGARIAGTVRSVTAGDIIVATRTGDVDISITPQTRVLLPQPAKIDDIKPGVYLGTANQDSADASTGTATYIHLLENGPNANSPMNNLGLTMTNGHVKAVTPIDHGKKIDIDYGQAATRHVVVGNDTPVSKMVDEGVAGLRPGLDVNATTTSGQNGKPIATFIVIGTTDPKAKP
jgi:hypothetical protein